MCDHQPSDHAHTNAWHTDPRVRRVVAAAGTWLYGRVRNNHAGVHVAAYLDSLLRMLPSTRRCVFFGQPWAYGDASDVRRLTGEPNAKARALATSRGCVFVNATRACEAANASRPFSRPTDTDKCSLASLSELISSSTSNSKQLPASHRRAE